MAHLIWSPTPQGRCVTTVLIFHTRKLGFRKVGDLAESLSLESQELTFGYLSVLKPACPPSPWLQPPLPPPAGRLLVGKNSRQPLRQTGQA